MWYAIKQLKNWTSKHLDKFVRDKHQTCPSWLLMEFRGCDCTRVLHCTAGPFWTSIPSSRQPLQLSTTSTNCSIHKGHTKFVSSMLTGCVLSAAQLPPIDVSSKRCTSLPLLKSSPFLFFQFCSGLRYNFLSISKTPWHMEFRALPWTSKKTDT